MKLFNKYFLMAVASCCLFTACSDDDDYTPGSPANTSGDNVYFSAENKAAPALGVDESEFTVTIERTNTGSAQSIPLKVATPHDSIFTVPASVDFASGEGEKTITIKTTDKMRMFKSYALSIVISEEYTQQYAETTVYPRIELNVIKEDYKPYATGMYNAGFFEESWEATLEYSEILNQYRFASCWMEGYDVLFAWDGAKVVVNGGQKFASGYVHSSYGMVSVTPGSCSYDASSKIFSFVYEWTVSAGTFGESLDTFTIK